MAEKDVVITYETLFEMLRIEKNREDLQKLNPSFFDDVLVYLGDKKALYDSKQSQMMLFASDEKEKTRLELDNIRKILKELYDRREKKIVGSAINKARTGVILVNTANMLPFERLLFDSVGMVLTEFRKNILHKLACGELPEVGALPSSILSQLSSNATESVVPVEHPAPVSTTDPEDEEDSTGGMHFRPLDEPKDLKITPSSTDSGANTKKVRFLAAIGEIVGPDLQIYGPYDQGAIIALPHELARVLVEKNQAEDITG